MAVGVWLVLRHFAVDPAQQEFNFGVDTKLPSRSTSISPAGGAVKIINPTSLTHHRSSTIPLTGVNSTLVQARADHGVVDLSWVGVITSGATDNWNLGLLKNIWGGSTGSKCAPARYPAHGTVSWFGDGIRKTNQIDATNKGERKLSRVALVVLASADKLRGRLRK